MNVLVVVDHASNHVPPEIDLGIEPVLQETHIAWDIGSAALADALGYPAHIASVSRLVIDLNRDLDAPALVPPVSDGHAIPGNAGDVSGRLAIWHAYHDALAKRIARERPVLLVSLHSFTPQLSMSSDPRPWEIGILYNNDNRAARIAIPLLEAAGIVTGDQLPYSGKVLNATMNRHGEGTGTPYLGIEMRQDLISDDKGVALWAARLRPVIDTCLDQLRASGTKGA